MVWAQPVISIFFKKMESKVLCVCVCVYISKIKSLIFDLHYSQCLSATIQGVCPHISLSHTHIHTESHAFHTWHCFFSLVIIIYLQRGNHLPELDTCFIHGIISCICCSLLLEKENLISLIFSLCNCSSICLCVSVQVEIQVMV